MVVLRRAHVGRYRLPEVAIKKRRDLPFDLNLDRRSINILPVIAYLGRYGL